MAGNGTRARSDDPLSPLSLPFFSRSAENRSARSRSS
jgi:hypothetical protein